MKRRTFLVFLAALALALAACGYSDTGEDTTTTAGGGDVGGATEGQQIFKSTCAACHGQNAEGIDGLGTQLSNSSFIQDQSDDDLIAFIVVGRPATDPDNTTGIAMPPKGGNPSLTDQDIADVVDYLRTLQ